MVTKFTLCWHLCLGLVLTFSIATASEASEDASGVKFGASRVAPGLVTVTVPATVQRGNVLSISASYAPLSGSLNSNCIVLLPAPNPPYKETLVYNRKNESSGITGHECPVYVPPFFQFEGTATIVVTVEGVGVGVATVQVTP
jgi:hypothetical protein